MSEFIADVSYLLIANMNNSIFDELTRLSVGACEAYLRICGKDAIANFYSEGGQILSHATFFKRLTRCSLDAFCNHKIVN